MMIPKKTPSYLQINPVECGAVALAIVLDYFGLKVSIESLHQIVGVSRDGSSAHAIVKAAQKFGLKAQAHRASIDTLPAQTLAILFFDSCHFVVYEGCLLGRFFINDPALGRYSLTREQLRRRFSGIFIALSAPSHKKKPRLAFFTRLIKKNALPFIVGVGSGWLFVIFALISGYIASFGLSLTMLALLVLSLVMLSLMNIFWLWRASLIVKFRSEKHRADLLALFRQVRPSFFTLRPFSRFKSALQIFSMPTGDQSLKIPWLCGAMTALFIIQASICGPFAITVLLGALMSALMVVYRPRPGPFILYEALERSLSQSWVNYPSLDAMGQNSFLFAQQMAQERALASALDEVAIKTRQRFVMMPIFIFLILIFYFYHQSMATNRWPISEITASLLLGAGIFYGAITIGAGVKDRLKMLQALGFKAELLEQALLFNQKNLPPLATKALIEVHNANFRYYGNENFLLKKINLSIEPGRLYALTGPPRSGTSTLLKILAQKLPLSEGSMTFNAQKWALIDDDAELFHGSLWDNVTLFDRHIKEIDVVSALLTAGIEELFLKRPLGLLTLIEDRGKNVSFGQKKRLLLARALVHKPSLLLLDDFFDCLDEERALSIIANLREQGLSVIFSSWRSNELCTADFVIKFNDGMAFVAEQP